MNPTGSNPAPSSATLWTFPVLTLAAGTVLGYGVGQTISMGFAEAQTTDWIWFSRIYPAFWGFVVGTLGSLYWKSGQRSLVTSLGAAFSWLFIWHALLAAFVAGGAATGSLLFLVVGSLAQLDYSSAELLRNGARDGGFYLLIWSPGLAMVLCIMRAYHLARQAPRKSPDTKEHA